MNAFDEQVAAAQEAPLTAQDIDIMQVNLGLACNQSCSHCHLSCGPERTEAMGWGTMELVLEAARAAKCQLVDLTGGAPEMNRDFRRFVAALHSEGIAILVRTNLTILAEPGYADIPEFLAERRVRLAASMPCYLEKNVDSQRGPGAYARCISALRRLNSLGYGIREELPLDLVYNPLNPALPPDQGALESDYRRELTDGLGIVFTHLRTIANMPLGRFGEGLRREGADTAYWDLLEQAFNPRTLSGLMCRHQLSVDWTGTIHDCDFNLALGVPVNSGSPCHIRDFDLHALARRRIQTGRHCFACTAGHGSSCGGALTS